MSWPEMLGVAVWALALVFLWTAAAKARRPVRAAFALVDFGLVRQPRVALGLGVAAAEFAISAAMATAMFVPGVLRVAASLAAVALVLFSAVMARSLARGKAFACFCFGSEEPLSIRALFRAVALAATAAALAVVAPPVAEQTVAAVAAEAGVAVSVVAVIALGATVPRLLTMNADPFGMADELWSVRA